MKSKRQEKILELINEKIILTQDELQEELMKLGYAVTQSTVSRDMKALKISKGHDAAGHYRYIAGGKAEPGETYDHYHDMFAGSVKNVDYALNNVVVKTQNGMASGTCVVIDKLFGDKVVGTLAGDDTIIIVTRNEEASAELAGSLKEML